MRERLEVPGIGIIPCPPWLTNDTKGLLTSPRHQVPASSRELLLPLLQHWGGALGPIAEGFVRYRPASALRNSCLAFVDG